MKKNIGETIKKLREQADLTQTQFAEKAGVSLPYISQLEDGRYKSISLKTSRGLADGLGLSLRDFLNKMGFLENNDSTSFQMIPQMFRSKGFSNEQVEEIMRFADYLKTKTKET